MSAERGWIGQPQPQRTSIPGEERKWRIMMGNGQFLTEEDKDRLSKIRAKAIRQAARRHVEEIQAEMDARERLGENPEEYRRYVARWGHLKHVDRSGNPADDWEPPSQISGDTRLQIAPRYAAGRPRRS